MIVRVALSTVAIGWVALAAYAARVEPQPLDVHAAQPAASPAAARSVWDGVYTSEQAQRGEAVYARECARCHGQSLEGNGEGTRPLVGIEFLSTWNGLTLGDLLDRIRLTMPLETPGKLKRQETADVLAYIVSANKFPAGTSELPRESERLKEIRFDALRGGR